jgi:3-oxoacyl-[acyl-carrier protein] reductase
MTPTSPVPPYPTPLGLLKGKTVVVTAAAGTGIGFSAAKRAAEEGARLLISDFHERRLNEAADRIAEEVGCARPALFVCDVTSEEAVQGLRDAALQELGKVDVLINNAGLGGEVDIVEMTDEQWSRVFDVTLTSLFRMTRAFLPSMYAAKSGVMVNNASVLGWRAQKGQAHYAAAKAGVMAFTRCAAIEAAEHGVRINAVSPSLAMHPFLAKVTTQEALERPAEVWEIANVMMFLASDLSSYMTGEIVAVSSQRA